MPHREGSPIAGARGFRVAACFVLLGVAPSVFLAQAQDRNRDTEKLQAIIAASAEHYNKADRDYAENLKATNPNPAVVVVVSEDIADAAARRAARATLTSAIKVTDEALKRRERILENTIVQVRAAAVDPNAKEGAVGAMREWAASSPPLAVRLMKATRAYSAKGVEILAHVDRNAAGVSIREGGVHFADKAAAARFDKLQTEFLALYDEMMRLSKEAKNAR